MGLFLTKIVPVSHLPERKEKVCLNCNAALEGRFCHICGQENIEPREGFWNMLTHFVFDLFHFDGKFFNTLKYLLFRPGYLSQEHLKGRRADYLHPIRMYVFTSAFFFLIYFNFFKDKQAVINLNNTEQTAAQTIAKLKKNKAEYRQALRMAEKNGITFLADSMTNLIRRTDSDLLLMQRDTSSKGKLESLKFDNYNSYFANSDAAEYKNLQQYDSVQKALPADKRDGFIEQSFMRKNFELEQKYHGDQKAIQNAVIDNFFHSFPSILFTSLPLFAFVLYLLYSRRKQYFYSDHLVYTIHLYCAIFIILFISMVSSASIGLISTKVEGWFSFLFAVMMFVYLYKSLKNFYRQSRKRTILKFMLLLLINLFLMLFLFVLFFLISAITTH